MVIRNQSFAFKRCNYRTIHHLGHFDNAGHGIPCSVHKALAQAYFYNGQISAALESTGDQYELEGYTELAIQQYDNALQQPLLNPAAKKRLLTKKTSLKPLDTNK